MGKRIKLNKLAIYIMRFYSSYIVFFLVLLGTLHTLAQTEVRYEVSLNDGWKTIAHDSLTNAYSGFEKIKYKDTFWKRVNVPHNWDAYDGYRRLKHGNRHGYAWYRKSFVVNKADGKRYFLVFQGVGSYATVWLNEKRVGYHAGSRTSFTIDVTDVIRLNNKQNLLAIRADHPEGIRDLPWVCGGCSEEVGFSEGSQPMGIFRPVHLVITDNVRIEPFGVHIWNDTSVSAQEAILNLETEIKNYTKKSRFITLRNTVVDKEGNIMVVMKDEKKIISGNTTLIKQITPAINQPHLWSLEDPYLYTVVTEILENGKVIDKTTTPYGIRWITWDIGDGGTNRFYLNGKPVFINGTAEYEHLMGQSHAFSEEQIRTRVMQIKAAGYNAFRDAHHPHHLKYHQYWDELGLLWWTQQSAHIWFDTPEFRENFKTLLAAWVKERRNSPSLVLWGLQNESKLPEDFARECTELIRKLDPTSSIQRKVTTCNGGKGTDWDVPQNWTGTYGGNPDVYHEDLQRQVLVGEYGAWRSVDLHSEDSKVTAHSEEKMVQLMKKKIKLAESVKDKCSGHFHWLFTSHENPGRVQGGEGWRELDRVGPVNYKGLFTVWGEPTDAFYMFRANYVSKDKEPMAYIVSHTWPNRWTTAGIKNNIVVYSNCDEVELFNDVGHQSLGKKQNNGKGTHFQWDNVDIQYNVLYAVGYVNGKEVVHDHIILHHLPKAPNVETLIEKTNTLTAPAPGLNYLYRVNCGGPDYTDSFGNTWMADIHKTKPDTWGSLSWTDDFQDMLPFYGSQRQTNDIVKGTIDYRLFQRFRYGRDKLRYEFPLPDGEYNVELYFTEPWYGTGGSLACAGWRLFDVAINDEIQIKDLDIWKTVGYNTALKKVIKVQSKEGKLSISFPVVRSGQAVIAAIAIGSANENILPANASPSIIKNFSVRDKASANEWSVQSWMDTGVEVYTRDAILFSALPPVLYGSAWIKPPRKTSGTDTVQAEFSVAQSSDVYIGLDTNSKIIPEWLNDYENTKMIIETDYQGNYSFNVYRKRFSKGDKVMVGPNGSGVNEPVMMYITAISPVTEMQPAVDLRPVVVHALDQTKITSPSVSYDTVLDKRCVTFSKNDSSEIQWKISPGVAGLYALRFRYYHTSQVSLAAHMKIISDDGTVMHEEHVSFNPVMEKKWKVAHSTTGTMINAGNYTVLLTPIEAQGLHIRELEMQ